MKAQNPSWMRRHAKKITIGLALAVIGGGWLYHEHSQEPVYRGHRLSEWLLDFDPEEESFASELATPEEAILHIGTNGLPVLLRMLQRQDFVDKNRLNEMLERFGIDHEFTPAADIHEAAIGGFFYLGRAAEPAVPKLAKLLQREKTAPQAAAALETIGGPLVILPLSEALNNSSPVIADAAAEALDSLTGFIVVSPSAVTPLVRALSAPSPDVQSVAEELLKSLTLEAETNALFALAGEITNSNPGVRRSVVAILGRFASQREQVLPVLTPALGDADPEVRYAAVQSFAWLDGDRTIAIPAWRNFLADPDRHRRQTATNMLVHLKDDAFVEVGRRMARASSLANRPVATPTTISNLTFSLSSANAMVRRIAATQLGRHGARSESALNALQLLRQDHDEDVRVAGSNALRLITADVELMKETNKTPNEPEE